MNLPKITARSSLFVFLFPAFALLMLSGCEEASKRPSPNAQATPTRPPGINPIGGTNAAGPLGGGTTIENPSSPSNAAGPTNTNTGRTSENACVVNAADVKTTLHLRDAPASTGKSLYNMLPNDKFTKTETKDGWHKGKHEASGKTGWACDTCTGQDFLKCGAQPTNLHNIEETPDSFEGLNPDGTAG
jgi:hypothetical protein